MTFIARGYIHEDKFCTSVYSVSAFVVASSVKQVNITSTSLTEVSYPSLLLNDGFPSASPLAVGGGGGVRIKDCEPLAADGVEWANSSSTSLLN